MCVPLSLVAKMPPFLVAPRCPAVALTHVAVEVELGPVALEAELRCVEAELAAQYGIGPAGLRARAERYHRLHLARAHAAR